MRIPKYSKHRGTGQARVRIDGRDIYLGRYNSPESIEKYRRLLAELQAGVSQSKAEDLTIGELVIRWLKHAATELSPKEHQQHRVSMLPLTRLYASLPASEFRPKQLRTVLVSMASGSWMNQEDKLKAAAMRDPIGWSRRVCNRRLTRIKTMWAWAAREELVSGESLYKLLTVKGIRKGDPSVRDIPRRRPATWDRLMAVVRVAKHLPRIQTMLLLQWWSGMRSCEVRTMRTEDIDTKGEAWLYFPDHDKNKWREDSDDRPRVVLLGKKCQALLKRFMRPYQPKSAIFLTRKGRMYSDSSYPQVVRKLAQKAGVKLTPYCLRHAAKRRIEALYGLDAARSFLGQRSLGSTAHYASEQDVQLATKVALKAG